MGIKKAVPLTWISLCSTAPQEAPTIHLLYPSPSGAFFSRLPTRCQDCHLLCPGPTSQISPTAAVRGWSPEARLAPSFSSALSSSRSDKSTTTFCTSFSPGTLTAATRKHKSGDVTAPYEKPPPTLQNTDDSWKKIFPQSPWGKAEEAEPRACCAAGAFLDFRRGSGAGRELCVETKRPLTLDSFGPELNASKLGDHRTSAGDEDQVTPAHPHRPTILCQVDPGPRAHVRSRLNSCTGL